MHILHESPELNNLSIAITNDMTYASDVYAELAEDVKFLQDHPEMKEALVDIKVQYLSNIPLHFNYTNGEVGLPITLYVKNTNWKPKSQSSILRKKVFGEDFLTDLSQPNKTIDLRNVKPLYFLYAGPRFMSCADLLNMIRVTYNVNFDSSDFQSFNLDTYHANGDKVIATLHSANESRFVGSLVAHVRNTAERSISTQVDINTILVKKELVVNGDECPTTASVFDALARQCGVFDYFHGLRAKLIDIPLQDLQSIPMYFSEDKFGPISIDPSKPLFFVKNRTYKRNVKKALERDSVFGGRIRERLMDPDSIIDFSNHKEVYLDYAKIAGAEKLITKDRLLDGIMDRFGVFFPSEWFEDFSMEYKEGMTGVELKSQSLGWYGQRKVGGVMKFSHTEMIDPVKGVSITAGKAYSQREIPEEFVFHGKHISLNKTDKMITGGVTVPNNWESIDRPVDFVYLLEMMSQHLPDVYTRSWNDPTYLIQSSATAPLIHIITILNGELNTIPNPLEWIADWMVKNKGWSEVKVYGNQLHCVAYIEIKGVTLRNSNVSS